MNPLDHVESCGRNIRWCLNKQIPTMPLQSELELILWHVGVFSLNQSWRQVFCSIKPGAEAMPKHGISSPLLQHHVWVSVCLRNSWTSLWPYNSQNILCFPTIQSAFSPKRPNEGCLKSTAHPKRVSHYPIKIPIQIDCFNGLQGSRSLGFSMSTFSHRPWQRQRSWPGCLVPCRQLFHHSGGRWMEQGVSGHVFPFTWNPKGHDMMMSVWTTYLSILVPLDDLMLDPKAAKNRSVCECVCGCVIQCSPSLN